THAIYVGLFASEVLPLRVGELVRAYLVSRQLPADFATVLPSILVERLFDAVWLATAVGLMTRLVELSHRLVRMSDLFAVFVLLCMAVLISFLIHRHKLLAGKQIRNLIQWKRARFLVHFLEHLAYGLHSIGASAAFFIALAISLVMLFFQAL